MKRFVSIAILLLALVAGIQAQGLRYSVCIVAPEFTSSERETMDDFALYMARAGMKSASRMLSAYKEEDTFGSGVTIEQDGRKYVLTNLHVVGYAQTVKVTYQLHEKTIHFSNCPVAATSPNCDLALVALPDDCEMVALGMYPGEVTEEMAIVAAGFPELADKPSWQLTRGYISNAQLTNIDNTPAKHIIQHTASIDPGSSGGPLLYKDETGKYQILGINTWKAFYREGVGLAIGSEDIEPFLQAKDSLESTAYRDLEKILEVKGEDWLFAFRQLPDSTQKSLRDMDWHMPLDPVVEVFAQRDVLIKSGKKKARQYDNSASHVVTDMENGFYIGLNYDNYLGMNQQAGLQLGYEFMGYLLTGLQINAVVLQTPTMKNDAGATFGLYLGGQVPISVGKYILAPRLTQSFGIGPIKKANYDARAVALLTDTRVGLDWRVPFPSCSLVLGVHYDMNWLWIDDNLQITPMKTVSFFSGNKNQYLQHGIGLSFGVAW